MDFLCLCKVIILGMPPASMAGVPPVSMPGMMPMNMTGMPGNYILHIKLIKQIINLR